MELLCLITSSEPLKEPKECFLLKVLGKLLIRFYIYIYKTLNTMPTLPNDRSGRRACYFYFIVIIVVIFIVSIILQPCLLFLLCWSSPLS